jgi:hypothetical protein
MSDLVLPETTAVTGSTAVDLDFAHLTLAALSLT